MPNVLAYVAELATISGLTGAEVLADRRYDPVVQELARDEPVNPGEPGDPGGLAARVAELRQAIEQGARSPSPSNLDLLAAYERLDRLGRPFNAVASVIGAPDRAEDGPGTGRPVAVKDIIAVAGVPTRCGSPSSDPEPAAFDAALVQRLRAAGYEVFATTQCLEYAAGFAHPEIGDTRNPRDPSRTSGGSSGGSAAVVAAGVCDLAVGTDTGGSVRIPAAYCGVVGLKPSYGRVPVDGVFPLSPSCDHVGTLTSTVAGAAELLAVMTSPEAPGEDSAPSEASLSSPPPVEPEPSAPPFPSDPAVPATVAPAFTVGLLAGQLTDPSVTAEVREAIGAALGRLTDAGWEIRELAAPWLDRLPDWEDALAAIVAYEAALVHADRDTSRYAEGTRALLAFGASLSDEQYAQALQQRTELADAIEASLAGVDVLAGPTVGYQAPEQDPPFGVGEDNGEGRFTGPYNLSGHPAVSLPVRVAGLPVGLQLAGRRDGDDALLRVAAAAERLISPNEGRPGE
jgi:aspartyl-tRNA(Asn)/glutamyl-tRNA(Gln) amidotransferase subunit A